MASNLLSEYWTQKLISCPIGLAFSIASAVICPVAKTGIEKDY